ncbi:MAG: hypothetical protein K9M10_02380 [Candidatus Pacebacteria bacterium]|nr:hypothetical protein [Candidatus Paceibacterota bacterium]MCF7857302.1 hypothetical protein [Candidatus Paceibacterota bacterium]
MDFLKHIQSKPREIKTRYAFFVAILVTGIIGSVWVSTVPARFSNNTIQQEEKTESKNNPLVDIFSTAKTQFGNIIEATKDTETSTTQLDSLQMEINAEEPIQEIESPVTTEIFIPETVEDVQLPAPVAERNTPKVIMIGTTTEQKME